MMWVTAGILFLVYLNVPAVAVRVHGVPFIVAALIPLALGIPVAYRVLLRGEELRFPRLFIAGAVLLCAHALSAVFSSHPQESVDSLATWLLEGVLLALLLANAIRTRVELRVAMTGLVAAGVAMGVIAILQQVLGSEHNAFLGFAQLDSAFKDADGEIIRRLAGPIGETNRFAQVMAVLLPIAAGLAMTTKRRMRFVFWLAAVIISAGMALAFSRGVVVALVLAIPFALMIGMLKFRHVLVTVGIGIGLLAAIPDYAERVASIGDVVVQSLATSSVGMRNADGAARGRLTEMKAAGLLFMEHPVLGAGPGAAPYHYERYAGVVGGKVRSGQRRSHNLFLHLAAETGLVGLAAFGIVLFVAFSGLEGARKRLESRDRQVWALVCGLELALVIFLATSLFLHAAYIRYFWILLGLAAAASQQQGAPALVALLVRMFRETAQRIQADA